MMEYVPYDLLELKDGRRAIVLESDRLPELLVEVSQELGWDEFDVTTINESDVVSNLGTVVSG